MPFFTVAVPFRSVCDDHARMLAGQGWLRRYLVWNRRGTDGIPAEVTRKFPALGLAAYAAARTLPPYPAEAARFALYPLYDAWAKTHLRPGDHIISSYAYANSCFRWVRRHGGKTFLDGGNSHPDNFWEILTEEHRRWKCPVPPVPKFYIERARRTVDETDFVIAPSKFVADSFLNRGFEERRILRVPYPLDLDVFHPGAAPPPDRPLTLVCTAGLSLRKGTPYLLEAFRIVRKKVPDARLLLTDLVTDSMKPLMPNYSDLLVEWSPPLPKAALADRLRSAHIFVLPSLEEGLVRTAIEAMACGLPVVLTPNTGASDFVIDGVNGSVVPIRDAEATAQAILFWWGRLREGYHVPLSNFRKKVSFETFLHLMRQCLSMVE